MVQAGFTTFSVKRTGKKAPFLELLESALETEEVRTRSVRILEPLTRYDQVHGGDLVHTLQCYFEFGGNASRTAEALFLHRNGLLYRLNRVEELLGVSLSDRDVAVALELSVRAVRPRHDVQH